MISTNHTPGPWTVDPSNNIQTVGGEHLAIVSGRQTVGAGPGAESKQEANRRRDEANARLIAAAPELLKALADLLGILEDDHYKCNLDSDESCRQGIWQTEYQHGAVRRAKQAIAKARGGA